MLAGCGLPELEAGVMAFLGGRAAVLHLVALLDDHERLLAQVRGSGRIASHCVVLLRKGAFQLQRNNKS